MEWSLKVIIINLTLELKAFYLLYMKKHGIAIATSSLSSDFTTNMVVNLTVGIFQFTSLGEIDSRSHL